MDIFPLFFRLTLLEKYPPILKKCFPQFYFYLNSNAFEYDLIISINLPIRITSERKEISN